MNHRQERRSTLVLWVFIMLLLIGAIFAFAWFAAEFSNRTSSLERQTEALEQQLDQAHAEQSVLKSTADDLTAGLSEANRRLRKAGRHPVTDVPDVPTFDSPTRVIVEGTPGRSGRDGQAGQDGQDGADGTDGAPGRGITNSNVNADGDLILTYSDGTVVNAGRVRGADGRDAEPVDLSEYATREWVLTLFNSLGCQVSVAEGPPNQIFTCTITR